MSPLFSRKPIPATPARLRRRPEDSGAGESNRQERSLAARRQAALARLTERVKKRGRTQP
ncbi:hypothetical protein [Arthrobacter pityocampae]|uniref:hypothetical protein n=1 Tax=Arthrobacter pityocampae TaxID=547334 RepID=UPI0037361FA3